MDGECEIKSKIKDVPRPEKLKRLKYPFIDISMYVKQ